MSSSNDAPAESLDGAASLLDDPDAFAPLRVVTVDTDEAPAPAGKRRRADAFARADVFAEADIDRILGLGDAGHDDRRSGIRIIAESALVSYERMPMLEAAFGRLVQALSRTLRNFTSDNVEVTLEKFDSVRFGTYLQSIPQPALMAIVKAEPWDNYGLLTFESGLIYALVDTLLGSRSAGEVAPVAGRPFTPIERDLIERVCRLILSDTREAFRPLTPVSLAIERLETHPRSVMVAQPTDAAVLVRLRISTDRGGGAVEFLLPYATLEPVRPLLMQSLFGERLGRSRMWERHLASELRRARLELHALLCETQMPLRAVQSWRVGDTIIFDVGPQTPLELRCGSEPVARGRAGRRGGRIALRLDDMLLRRASSLTPVP